MVSRRCFLGLLASAVASRSKDALAKIRTYLIGTASPGGTFYPVGTALATVANAALQQPHGLNFTAVTTAGSSENLRLLRSGELQFAILQGLFGHERARMPTLIPASTFHDQLHSVTALWPNVEQFVVRREGANTGTVDDLLSMKGRRVVLGDRNSGTLASSRVLLGNLGVDIDQDYELVYLGYGPSTDALRNGEVAAIALPAGTPTRSLARLKSEIGDDAVILSFTDEQARRADGGFGLWHRHWIPAETYPGQIQRIATIAQPNFLAVRADTAERDVYLMTRAIFENLPLLQSMHASTRAMSLDGALSGLPLPLHRGSLKFFEENSVKIPIGLHQP